MSELRHNTSNPITVRIAREQGGVRKVVSGAVPSRHVDWTSSEEPQDWRYWRREPLAYQAGLTQVWADHGLRAPRLLEVVDEGEQVSLLLEDVRGRTGAGLTVDDHVELARRLARAQGTVGQVDRPWTSQGFLRAHCASKHVRYDLLDDDEAWAHPLVRSWPDESRALLGRLHAERQRLFAICEAAPRVLCHLDLWAHNLVWTDTGPVLLDWAVVGEGALGEDAANLVAEAVLDQLLPLDTLAELFDRMREATRQGLAEVGRSADQSAVDRAFLAAAVKFHWLAPMHLERALTGGHHRYGGHDADDPAEQYRVRGAALAFLAQRALALLG